MVINRLLLSCNSMTKKVCPLEKRCLSYDDKSVSKYASLLSIIGLADFETKLDELNYKVNSKDTLKNKECFTKRKRHP